MNICLKIMTKDLARRFYQGFVADPDLFMDDQEYKPYVYSPDKADAAFERQCKLRRIYLAVMLCEEPIGEIVLKNIDREKKHCTLGISLRSDEFKNKGYGTAAEILAVEYAFQKMGMETVYADSLLKNTRSQHVLQKVGFAEMSRDEVFVYYRCDKHDWQHQKASFHENDSCTFIL